MGGDNYRRGAGAAQLEDQVVEQLPRGVAPVRLGPPPDVGQVEGVDCLGPGVQPLRVVSRELGVRLSRETVDGVRSLGGIQLAEEARVQLPVGVVALPREAVGPDAGGRADVFGPKLDVVAVQKDSQFAELVHERGGS
jgi:hypothetical protein